MRIITKLMKIASIFPPYDIVGPDVNSFSAEAEGTFLVGKMTKGFITSILLMIVQIGRKFGN